MGTKIGEQGVESKIFSETRETAANLTLMPKGFGGGGWVRLSSLSEVSVQSPKQHKEEEEWNFLLRILQLQK